MDREPVLTIAAISAIVTAVIALAVAFGAPLTDDQQKAVLALVAALAPVAAGLWARRHAYSPASVRALRSQMEPRQ